MRFCVFIEVKHGAPARALPSSKSCCHCVVGTSVMAPRRPLAGRVRTNTMPSARRAFAFRRSPRQCFGFAARIGGATVVPGTQRASWVLRRADGRAEIYHG